MSAALGVIGAGTMGSAILRGALEAHLLAPSRVIVAEPNPDRRNAMAALGCCLADNAHGVKGAEHILFAVKPQAFAKVVEEFGALDRSTVIISIMAGLSSRTIRSALGPQARVVLAMPNTPARVGAGMTAIALGEGAQPGDELFVRDLFLAVGQVVQVDESHMHAATAVSGSGPAYVFLLAEAMEQAGTQIGLEARTARRLAYQTILGAGRLLTEDKHTSADALRTAVTSPGGTTAAALEVMFEKELPQIVTEAITAARDRGIELDAPVDDEPSD